MSNKSKTKGNKTETSQSNDVIDTTAVEATPQTTSLVQGTAQALVEVDDEFNFGAHAGENLDTIGKLLRIPYAMIVQPGTPGVNDKTSKFYQKVGCLFDPLTERFYSLDPAEGGGIQGVIVKVVLEYVERLPENQERKFVGKHAPDSPTHLLAVKHTATMQNVGFGKLFLPNGNSITETHACWGVWRGFGENDVPFMAIIPVKSSGIPALQGWSSGVALNRTLPNGRTFTRQTAPPLYCNLVRMTGELTKKGQYNWIKLGFAPLMGDYAKSIVSLKNARAIEAMEMIEAFASGKAEVAEETVAQATGATDEEAGRHEGGGTGGDAAMDF